MGGANRDKVQDKKSRKNKSSRKEEGRVIKGKFEEGRNPPALLPKNDKQKHYITSLHSCNVVVGEGLFGTGKSYCAAVVAADKLRKHEIKKIIVARPYVQTGKTAGFRPGDTYEKLYPYVRNILDTVKERIGVGAYEIALRKGDIEVQALEDIRGRSFDEDCFLIIDESQQSTPEEMLSIVTRISDSCTLVLCGDDSQRDIKGVSGLSWFKEFADRHKLPDVGFVNFNHPDDIVRGGFVREVAFALAKDNGVESFQ